MAIRPPSRNCLLLVSFPNICYSVEKEADNHGTEGCDRRAAAEAWIFSAGPGRPGVCHPSGGVPVGERGDGARPGHAEAALPAVQRVHQHPAGLPGKADLPVLRDAPGGQYPQPRAGRDPQPGLLPVVLCRRRVCLHRPEHPHRLLCRTHGQPRLAGGSGPGLFTGHPAHAQTLETPQ